MASAEARVVLLTGAAGGIGLVMTDALLAAGHRVAAVDRDARALDRLSARHLDAKDRLHPIVANLAEAAGCASAIAAARARFGAIEAVINNAGIGMSSVGPMPKRARRTLKNSRPKSGTASWRSSCAHRSCSCAPHCRI
jgi:NAD(P)-dependent dehydrogenase (short-subunit alcohol dehydrogenase family)